MQRKQFQFIADTIRAMPDKPSAELAAFAFADNLHKMNPRFKRELFLKACGADSANPGNGIR